jgi:hypothetical protein
VVWSLEWGQSGYHIAGSVFARRKAGWEANGEKGDFVAVRKCVSNDSAGVSPNSNCVNVAIRIARPRRSGSGKARQRERKNREIFAIRNF